MQDASASESPSKAFSAPSSVNVAQPPGTAAG
jgi:hypothetical protein